MSIEMLGRLVIFLMVAVNGAYAANLFSKLICGAGSMNSGSSRRRGCFVPDTDRYQYFGSRTSYTYAHGTFQSPSDTSCQPIQVWAFMRHGTKYPDKKTLPKIMNLPQLRNMILNNHIEGSGQLCPADIQRLTSWNIDPNFSPRMDEYLAQQGVADMSELAERLRNAYPNLFMNARHDDFIFRSTNTQRTQESMHAFIRGLFGSSEGANIIPSPEPDITLKPFNACPNWLQGKKNKFIYAQRDEFTNGPVVQKILQDVSVRFGFRSTISFEDFIAFYEACRFENALYVRQVSIWCSLLTKSEIQAMELREDLRLYYYVGPGRAINAKMGCFLLKDMHDHFSAVAAASSSPYGSSSMGASSSYGHASQPKGIFYFGHSKNIQTLLTAFRIGAGDRPLKASNYASSSNRQFRASTLGGFGSNFIAILHQCRGNTFKAVFHASEHLTPVEGCRSASSCELQSFLSAYQRDVDTCSMEDCFN